MSLRVRELKICTRPPEVTAKVSLAPVVIEVIALLCGEGTSNCDLKVRQYAWSAVRGAGPGAARTGAVGCTSAAIVYVCVVLNESVGMLCLEERERSHGFKASRLRRCKKIERHSCDGTLREKLWRRQGRRKLRAADAVRA